MYDEHTKIGLLVLRQHLGVPYRELCLMLPSLRAWRGRVPDHSTLVKFSGRVGQGVLEAVLRATASMLCGCGMTVAVDSTGFSCSSASRHFTRRLVEMGQGEGMGHAGTSRKRFLKASLAVDTGTLVVLACDCVDSRHTDVRRMTHVVDGLVDGGYGISYVVADKGYDVEYVHREVSERLGARAFIPPRSSASPARASSTRVRTSGFHRGLMRSELDLGVYARRALVETVNSMVKRKMGGRRRPGARR